MSSRLSEALPPAGPLTFRKRATVLCLCLVAFNIGAWVWAFVSFHRFPLLMGSSLLAYSFGLRHAVDADHIAAIDNVTRKLMQAGRRPTTVGLMFSLGHSTIVVAASIGIAATAMALQHRFAAFQEMGALIGTIVSTLFLFVIASINFLILVSIVRVFRRVQSGEAYRQEDVDHMLADRGLLARLFRPVFRLISKSWHMYFLGFLFGLGFDTATEVGLLGVSAAGATHGLPLWSILVFPVLFTAGMTLVDTADSIVMVGAYGWAFAKPVRKLYYNMTITAISVVVALMVAGIEGLGLLAGRMPVSGRFWDVITALNDHFGTVGYVIVGVFIASWLLSLAWYKWKRIDKLEPWQG